MNDFYNLSLKQRVTGYQKSIRFFGILNKRCLVISKLSVFPSLKIIPGVYAFL